MKKRMDNKIRDISFPGVTPKISAKKKKVSGLEKMRV